ncbi:conserved hypothetical protein [Theileria equi strain WA]|uniref:Uncharacterized protein n=1 Tax=Theileria equi strain WA TaxID=1537102 RepID=L1LC77_THEEQ|nr:conserved hypothetical protein [Theileria equi strain WA]EKX72884.1 conserved hypothetical protein [Theileria equi strain WA]|eukprot:XP_004832336.1 conserved hypothetical protein [Theileria equi strain WA]
MESVNSVGNDDLRTRYLYEKYVLRTHLIEQAVGYSKGSSYKRLVALQNDLNRGLYRNFERESIQRDANMALLRKDCREANFAEYIPSSYDDLDYAHYRRIQGRSTHAEATDFRYTGAGINPDIIETQDGKWNTDTSQVARITVKEINLDSICNTDSRYSSIVNQNLESYREPSVVEELVKNGMSPMEVARLSDVFQHPLVFRKVSQSIIPWLKEQTIMGYWNNNVSLFILCLTIAISVGSVETIFKLNDTWGMVFLLTYLLSYILVVQPMICFELTTGQLYRAGPSAIFDKLVSGCGGIGTTMVLLCIISGCIACGRTSAEYMIYFINVFKKRMPWKITGEDMEKCATAGASLTKCKQFGPLCAFVDGKCSFNAIGKAYLAYQDAFDNDNASINSINVDLVYGMIGTYSLVWILQMFGLTNFTFSAFIILILLFFLVHMQLYSTLVLDGATDYLWDSFSNIKFSLIFQNSRIWSHSIRCCIYEYIVGNGIYSTLASKSRIGYDLSNEAVGVGLCSGYVTSLVFITASAIVGYYSKILKTQPSDILWLLKQNCSFILLPLGFPNSRNMERTLLVLLFGCGSILICATLAIQIEVLVVSIVRLSVVKIHRRYISTIVCILLLILSIPLCSRSGKRVIWFLEIAVGDLGRVFMVLMSCIVIGWLYGTQIQIQHVGKVPLYIFNGTFWVANIIVALCETFDETVKMPIWWLVRFISIIFATIIAVLSYKYKIGGSLNEVGEKNVTAINEGESIARDSPLESIQQSGDLPIKTILYYLYFGNIEHFRSQVCRITPMNRVGGVSMTILWSISIKWVASCLLSNTLADVLEEVISDDIAMTINEVSKTSKWPTLGIWGINTSLNMDMY